MIEISYDMIVFIACLIGGGYTSWYLGFKAGGTHAINFLADNDMLLPEPDIDEED